MNSPMLIKLNKKNYDLLKSIDFSPFDFKISFHDDNLTFDTDDVLSLQIALNYEISLNGMTDDQMECTEYGRELYALYDVILDQVE